MGNILYKVTQFYTQEYRKDIDFTESKYKIEFPNNSIYKVQFDELIIDTKEGFIAYTEKSSMIDILQKEIIKLMNRHV